MAKLGILGALKAEACSGDTEVRCGGKISGAAMAATNGLYINQ